MRGESKLKRSPACLIAARGGKRFVGNVWMRRCGFVIDKSV
jgi:hypothetical protein